MIIDSLLIQVNKQTIFYGCFVKSIGERIKLARENAHDGLGISQAELAELTGIKQASLSQIESDKTTPRKPTLIAL